MSAQAHDHDTGQPLVPVEEAQRRAMALVRPLPPRRLALREAHGCVAAEEVPAPRDLPPFASSAMDGFAVRAADVAGASADAPAPLRIVGRVVMGRAPEAAVGPGQAVAVPTGGVVPGGADCVIPIERCVVDGDVLRVLRPEPPGRYVRPAGEDARPGERLIARGRRLLAPELGLLASAGIGEVSVHPRPRVLVVSTGDELVDPGASLAPGTIPDANAVTLHAAIAEAGAVPVPGGIVPDDPAALLAALARDDVDVLVSSGGVSVGERDPVKRAFAGRGSVEFQEVAMQPGKPQAFGTFDGRPFFGLPGNPVSVFVSFEVFVRPALMTMMGRPPERPEVTATLESDIRGPAEKTQFARVRVRREEDGWVAASTGSRQSNLLSTVAWANGLAVIPPGVETASAGERCRVILFRDPEEDLP